MKKVLGLLLILLVFSVSAYADTSFVSLEARDVVLHNATSTLGIRPVDSSYYHLINAAGETIADGQYTSMSAMSGYPYFKVEAESTDGIHNDGIIDDKGNVIVPPVYADVDVWSDRWCSGVLLTPSTADDKDYTFTNFSSGDKSFWRIDKVDFFYCGEKVGTLDRTDYGGYVTTRGDFIDIQNQAGKHVFYDSKMQKSTYEARGSSEYDSVRVNGNYVNVHQPTGQYAFTEGCTLTEDQVEDPFYYDKAVMYDLQGKVVFKAAQNYDYFRGYSGKYAVVNMNGMKGIVDREGHEIIPVIYKELGNYEDELFKYGYVSAVLDGKFGFLDLQGNVTCPFTYSSDIVSNRGTFGSVKNLDGTIIVLSAAVGELPEHYKDVSFCGSYGSMAFVAENDNKQYALIDLYGNTVIPFSDTYNSIYVNQDGTVALAYKGSRMYDIYTLDIQQAAPADETVTVATEESSDGTWTCENGHAGNKGKFCTECGAPKPAEIPLVCPTCGNQFEEGNVPKFCPECGTKLHD